MLKPEGISLRAFIHLQINMRLSGHNLRSIPNYLSPVCGSTQGSIPTDSFDIDWGHFCAVPIQTVRLT